MSFYFVIIIVIIIIIRSVIIILRNEINRQFQRFQSPEKFRANNPS